ncbi:uncharacterized protein LOC143429307 [Xylocopa sonorina]|uniref:uncharacterized protein LOC143429307 n=1 Tax=Xylocopa sonorina TaxID=1818115 RepID=UPI00403A939D
MFDTEKFIEEIEKRPAIYDVNRSEYNDRNAKTTAWDEVCQVMVPNWAGLTDEERNVEEKSLRGKWRNIRDYFMKELKLQKSQKLGPAGRKRKKYMYFDQLLFLMPTVENKRLVSSVSPCLGIVGNMYKRSRYPVTIALCPYSCTLQKRRQHVR